MNWLKRFFQNVAKEPAIFFLGALLIATFLVLFVTDTLRAVQNAKEINRLTVDCMDAGHREYECVALLKDCR